MEQEGGAEKDREYGYASAGAGVDAELSNGAPDGTMTRMLRHEDAHVEVEVEADMGNIQMA